jgi:hypothetical protein
MKNTLGEKNAQRKKSGAIALLLPSAIQSVKANIRCRLINKTTDGFKQIANKCQCFKCVHLLRSMRTTDEIISAINKNE